MVCRSLAELRKKSSCPKQPRDASWAYLTHTQRLEDEINSSPFLKLTGTKENMAELQARKTDSNLGSATLSSWMILDKLFDPHEFEFLA